MAGGKKQQEAEPLLLSIEQTAKSLHVCRAQVYKLIYYAGLPSIKIGKLRRVVVSDLHQWVAQQERTA